MPKQKTLIERLKTSRTWLHTKELYRTGRIAIFGATLLMSVLYIKYLEYEQKKIEYEESTRITTEEESRK